MIGLEQWRASIGGWNSRTLSVTYRRYGSRRIVRGWSKLLLISDNYSTAVYYSVYWLIVVLFALMSEDGLFVALSLAFDNNCGYSDTLSMLVKSPTSAATIQAGRDSLECLWVSTKPSVTPILQTCTLQWHRLCTLASPSSTAPMLRLLLALNWLLIVAGDVELNPGPLPTSTTESLGEVVPQKWLVSILPSLALGLLVLLVILYLGCITANRSHRRDTSTPAQGNESADASLPALSSHKRRQEQSGAEALPMKSEAGPSEKRARHSTDKGGNDGAAGSGGDSGDGGVTGITELLPTVDASVLAEEDIYDVINEISSLAGRWRNMCLALRLLPSDETTIASSCRDNPDECLKAVLIKWLKKCYNTQKHGPPTWQKLVAAVANSTGGDNPALAKQISEKHQGTAQTAGQTGGPPTAKPSSDSSKAVTEYVQYLRGRYQMQIPTVLTLQWPPLPTRKKVLRLAMIQGDSTQYGSIDEDMVRLTLQGKVNDILDRKTPVELKDICQKTETERGVILIEGAPGAGKSTLAWHICQQWGAGELFQNFQTVVFIQLRDPAIQSAKSVEDILPPAVDRSQAEKVVAEMRVSSGKNLLFVMDGWDELPVELHTNSIFYQLIASPETLNLHFSTVIITSRPVASGDLYRCGTVSSRIEILGFTPTEVKDYFTEALKGNSEAVQKLQDQLRERPMIEASCYLPLNAAIVTHLFQVRNHSLPTTLHGVFTSLVLCCLVRHMTKQGESIQDDMSSLDDLPPHLQQPLKNISTLAYHGVMENKATFSAIDLKQLELPQKLGTLGLMQGVESFTLLKSSVTYNFLHLSVQELLASFYISRLPENKEIETFEKLFGQPRFASVFRFYAAFTKLETAGIRKIISDIVKRKEKTQLLYLLHGLYEAQSLSLCEFVASQLGGKLNFRNTTLSPVDCITVGFLVSCICLTGSGKFRVDLSYCSLDDYRVSFLSKELHMGSSSVGMSAHSLVTRDDEVSGSSELSLDLRSNQITAEGIQSIGEILKVNQSLRTLNLYNNQIGASGAAHIAEGLRQNNHLEILNLTHNGIAHAGAAALAEALQHNNSLQVLNLQGNQITDVGARALGEALRVNQSLIILMLYDNQISSEIKTSLRKEFPGRVKFNLF